MNLKEMKQFLIDNNDNDYNNKFCNFSFNDVAYNAQVHFAYFNSHLDMILKKYNIKYDDDFMLKKEMTVSNYNNFMNYIVKRLYDQNYDLDVVQDLIIDIVTLFNKMVNLFNSGNPISHDISLISISNAMEQNKEIEKLFLDNHIREDMTPEQLYDKREEIVNKIIELDIPGISDLIRSGSGIKADECVNMFFGLFMRVKPSDNLDEIYPRQVPECWVDGIENRDTLFIEHSIQRLADILNNQTMKKSGEHNKVASILAQDCEIVEMDCGSKNYQKYFIEDETDLKSIRYKYRVEENGLVECTDEDKHLIGTTVQLRSIQKCNTKDGVCATCFGSNAKWNYTNDEYRYDVGFVAARKMNSDESQKVLSVKHTSTPKLIRAKFDVIDIETGEIIIDGTELNNDFFIRKWNELLFNSDTKVYMEVKDIIRGKSRKKSLEDNILYLDTEFAEYDIIRCSTLYLEKDNKEYELKCNSNFRVSGFPKTVTKNFNLEDRILLNENNKVTYVVRNNEHVMNFKKLQYAYKLSTDTIQKIAKENFPDETEPVMMVDQMEYLYDVIKPVVKGLPVSVAECALRNKIRDINNDKIMPDWSIPNQKYQILSSAVAIAKKGSLSVVLQKGNIYRRLTDATFHDEKNLQYSVFDLLYKIQD